MKDGIEGDMAPRAAAALDVCSGRHGGLPFCDLVALIGRLEAAIRVLADDGEDDGGRIFSSDRDDEIVRPTTTGKDEIPVCRPQKSRNDAAADALRHITLDMLAAALPFDWRVRIERSSGAVSWASLTAVACERAARSAPPSCYPDAEYIPSVFEGGTWFLGAPVAAARIAYRFQITIPTGAGSEPYVSPDFLSNPDTGFSLIRTPEDLAEIAAQPTITRDGTP